MQSLDELPTLDEIHNLDKAVESLELEMDVAVPVDIGVDVENVVAPTVGIEEAIPA